MSLSWLPADDVEEVPYDCGDNCITVYIYRSDVRGQLKPSHKVPEALWMHFTQEEKDIWLSFSVDTRKRILSCSANDTSIQQREGPASSMSSAVRQHILSHMSPEPSQVI